MAGCCGDRKQGESLGGVLHPAIVNIEPCPEPVALTVKGSLPPYLCGSLYRVGPGTFDIQTKDGGTFTVGHWFDGISMMHKFDLEGTSNAVKYRSRCIAEEQKDMLAEDGGSYVISFGTDPCYGIFGRAFTTFRMMAGISSSRDGAYNIGVDVKEIATDDATGKTRLVSTSDQGAVLEFDPDTLAPTGSKVFNYSSIPGLEGAKGMMSSTHGQRDATKKEYFNFVLFIEGPPKYHIFCIPDDKPAYVLASFAANPAYVHSFGLTEHYFILLIWPSSLVVMPPKILFHMNVMGALQWQPQNGVQIFVIDRRTGAMVGRFKSDPFYCFHTVNSFEIEEDGGRRTVCVDLITYEDMSIIENFKIASLRERKALGPSKYSRVTMKGIDVAGSVMEETQRADVQEVWPQVAADLAHNIEFGSIHPAWHMQQHRYVYVAGATTSCDTGLFDRIGKLDVRSGETKTWSEAGCSPGEPIFFPRPRGASEDGVVPEDDGVVLTMVNGGLAKSFLLILDARTLKEVARAETPSAFPLGFHGKYVSHL